MNKLLTLSALSLMVATAHAENLTLDGIESDINWDTVPMVQKSLFFPGKVTYAWLNSEEHKGTSHKNFETRKCSACHIDEERGLGDMLVKSDVPQLKDKNGSVVADMQFAHDDEYLYIRTEWAAQSGHPGRMHNMIEFDGKKWKSVGGDRMSKPEDPLYEDRLSFMIDDGSVAQFGEQGCFMSCHAGERDLDPATKEQSLALPVIGLHGLNKDDIRKYLPESRTDGSSWDKPKSQEEIDRLKAKGQFVDLMQWRSTRSGPIGYADDGYVFEYRLNDSGKTVFTWNVDRKTMIPKYMYDIEKTGFYAINREDNNDLTKQIALVEGVNTMPYDASKIKPGQMLQGRLLRMPDGSAGDNSGIASEFKDGKYTVVFKRKFDTGSPEDDKIMKIGGTYNFNVAIHDDSTTTRSHFVTFPFDVGIGEGAEGDVISHYLK
ncbi:ethylbenzene dehydrogenase-related protein [Photobacterium profundum]|uniref:ethylbenzene dehydrogenase-related protein n=1 Tax=Photobacterium profundum TaxID=74109 RepID=UPI003D0B5ADA